jgi:acyl carrier protein
MNDALSSTIQAFILQNYLFSDDQSALGLDDGLLERGIVDSAGILDIILFIEERFGVSMKDYEITPDNLDSVNKIARYVQARIQRPTLACP